MQQLICPCSLVLALPCLFVLSGLVKKRHSLRPCPWRLPRWLPARRVTAVFYPLAVPPPSSVRSAVSLCMSSRPWVAHLPRHALLVTRAVCCSPVGCPLAMPPPSSVRSAVFCSLTSSSLCRLDPRPTSVTLAFGLGMSWVHFSDQ